jgi:glycosyltransferase involved in cell wall biosynthesis
LLLIDDGSTDTSGRICDEYAIKDSRIRVFHKENGGVSSARNMGLDNAIGEWITFADSDDYILKDAFSIIVGLDTDLLVGSFLYNDTEVSLNEYSSNNIIEDTALIEFLIRNISISTVWGKLFKLSYIRNYNIHFDETLSTAEDTLFICNYLYYIKSIALSKKNIYCYDRRRFAGLSWERNKEWFQEARIIDKLYNIYDILQDKFRISFDVLKIGICQYRLDSFIGGLKRESLLKIYRKIKPLVYDKNMDVLWNDKTELPKGERRAIFDFLAKKKLMFLLSLYIKLINSRY